MIKRLAVFDFDGTLIDTPMPETGKPKWSEVMGKPYPFKGWWGRAESLDLKVFDIKAFPSLLKQLKKEESTPDTYILILTSRLEKLRPEVEAVLKANNINVDKLDMKRAEGDKGVKLLRYIKQFPDLEEIDIFEDRDVEIKAYEAIKPQIPEKIKINLYLASDGNFALTENQNKLLNIIQEEIRNLIEN